MMGWFELSKSSDGQFRFVLKASNGETILTSELYKARGSAESGIASVQNNCALEQRYDKKVAAKVGDVGAQAGVDTAPKMARTGTPSFAVHSSATCEATG